jgi:hypothetical protein
MLSRRCGTGAASGARHLCESAQTRCSAAADCCTCMHDMKPGVMGMKSCRKQHLRSVESPAPPL